MANIKQQKKRILTAQRQREENFRYRSAAKTYMRSLQDAVNLGEKDTAAKIANDLQTLLDRAVARNVLHKNTASRRKARAARILVSEPIQDEAAVRRAKQHLKKAAAPKKKAAPKTTAAAKAKAKKAEEAAAAAAAEAKAAEEAAAAAETEAAAEPEAEAVAEEAPAVEAEATEEAAAPEAEAEAAEEAPAEEAAAEGDEA